MTLPPDQQNGLHVDIRQESPIPLDAQFSCAEKELLALVGPSGGGKSTLLRAIAGIFKPTSCDVTVDGETWSNTASKIHLPTHRRRVGMVFQSYALFPHMNTLSNVAAAITGKNAQDKHQFAMKLLKQVNLSGLEYRKPRELSGGQQQRIAVARALAREPRVLLLDEPFTAVDKITRRRLYREIIKLRRELEIPVVLVTHDLDEAAMLADTMVVLHKGRTLQIGTPLQITTQPNSAELARLVDIRNVFDGKLVSYDAASNRTQLAWAGITLEVSGQVSDAITNGSNHVQWAIPDGCVVVERPDRPSKNHPSNRIAGNVEDILFAGQTAQITLRPHHDDQVTLYASTPLRIVRLNNIRTGSEINVSLTPGDIHVMRT